MQIERTRSDAGLFQERVGPARYNAWISAAVLFVGARTHDAEGVLLTEVAHFLCSRESMGFMWPFSLY